MPSRSHDERYQALVRLLVDARIAEGVTQVELAQRLGKPQSWVSKGERGERRIDMAEFCDIAEALGRPAWHLLKDADKKS